VRTRFFAAGNVSVFGWSAFGPRRMRNDHNWFEPVRGGNRIGARDSAESPMLSVPPDSDYGSEEHCLSAPSSSSERSRSVISCSRGVEDYLDGLIRANQLRLTRD
jgi:hypothetical protein